MRLLRTRAAGLMLRPPAALTTCVALAGLLIFGSTRIEADDTRPNIIFILADDVGFETLGCYGGTSYETPQLDRMAAEGLRFRNGFSMPVCHPTRVCFLTGKYPFRLEHPRWGSFPADHEDRTIASVLKRAGYATAIAGKWQLALLGKDLDHPHRMGFDDYCLFGWHEGPRYYEPLIWQNGQMRMDVQDRYGPDVYCEFVIDFMKRVTERNRQSQQRQPFFAFYSMALCHDVTDDLKQPVPRGPKGRYDSYEEMIENMDREVGRILDALDRLKIREETLVVFTGDNGSPKTYIATAEGQRLIRRPVVSKWRGQDVPGGKGELTDFGTNVPLLASWPGTAAEGKAIDDLVDMSDYFATFAELAEAELPDGALDSRSFANRLTRGESAPRAWAFAEGRGGRFWVRSERWKLYNDGRLFDLDSDRPEQHPLSEGQGGPDAQTARRRLQPVVNQLGGP